MKIMQYALSKWFNINEKVGQLTSTYNISVIFMPRAISWVQIFFFINVYVKSKNPQVSEKTFFLKFQLGLLLDQKILLYVIMTIIWCSTIVIRIFVK